MPATLLLVHGAWHGSWCWERLTGALGGVAVRTVDLPSVGTDPAALGGLYDDADAVRAALAGIEGPVVVVGHSYGGAVVTEAVRADSGVAHLVYLCAFQLDEGDSLLGSVGGEGPPWWEATGPAIAVRSPEQVFYNGVAPELTESAVARLGLQSRASAEQPLTNVAWRSVPSTYVVCEQDQAIPVVAQEAMSARAGEVLRMDAGHSPFLSHPAELAGLLRPIVDRAG
ncbi:alpha/beta hydrolase [Geodermatophilus sabuli]|uniref:Pimeloyl-ACP methyl ester carboxylesterase n=1 Tax=Geodermatophilus sabuli TaxID=1564158 RepID=A0A285E9K9_9ACTN|nr:alpha/beta hydrolase [Geodermatophilus sabuli]MBB3084877.1 pimeloyl-ACP methyl ester carboxylesterase [Geodermatophilus sabuli]SNX95715.1 Pimeloyl-ACP methyl ester carboxylesterase [Geodermatophilus sabuli]